MPPPTPKQKPAIIITSAAPAVSLLQPARKSVVARTISLHAVPLLFGRHTLQRSSDAAAAGATPVVVDGSAAAPRPRPSPPPLLSHTTLSLTRDRAHCAPTACYLRSGMMKGVRGGVRECGFTAGYRSSEPVSEPVRAY